MRIAFIGQKGIPATNGEIEKNVENIAVRLAEMGHDVFVYTRNNFTNQYLKEYRGVKIIHINGITTKNLDTISHAFLATIHSLFQSFDVIHYQGIGSASLCFIPKILKTKTLVISTFYSRSYKSNKWGWLAKKYLKFAELIACQIPDKTIVTSKNLRSYVFSKYNIKATYIPTGADVGYNPETKTLARWDLRDKKFILSAGEISKHKGIKSLIEVFRKIEDTNKLPNNFKLVIIKTDQHADKSLRKISGKKSSIIFTANQSGATLEQLFSHAYLFIQPTDSEGLTNYLMDAMGSGTAPLVSDVPVNIEIIGKCGFSFRSFDKNNFEEKLAYLLNKPNEVEKMGKIAKDRIQKEYSWDWATRKNLRIYESVQKNSHKYAFRKIQGGAKSYVQ